MSINRWNCLEDIENLTPNKKRKRFVDNLMQISSTPIKETGAFDNPALDLGIVSPKTTSFYSNNKDNLSFIPDGVMEVKSISDLIKNDYRGVSINPFEIARKPPKKKKKSDIVDGCFVNSALNLNGPEKEPINPFEVRRPDISINRLEDKNHCFSRQGPEIRSNLNQFEISRQQPLFENVNQKCGIQNPCLEMQPTPIAIALPFTPTIGRRINFKDLQITQNGFMKNLALNHETRPHSSRDLTQLSIISEEAFDIDEELDCYQLELENSINEAKTKRKKGHGIHNKSILAEKLTNIHEENDEQSDEIIPEIKMNLIVLQPDNATFVIDEESEEKKNEQSNDDCKDETKEENNRCGIELFDDNNCGDVQYEEVEDSRLDDHEFDFQDQTPFQRTFRRSIPMNKPMSKETIDIKKSTFDGNGNFTNMIRRSIRKILHPKHEKKSSDNKSENDDQRGLMSSIRHFTKAKPTSNIKISSVEKLNDLSIIDTGDKRMVFRQPRDDQFDIAAAVKMTSTKTSIRSSLRKSTKEVKHHMMKSILKKNAEIYKI